MYQPRAVPDSQDDPAFGVRRVLSLPSPEKRGAALGPTQGQVDARRNLSVGAEIVSAETFALWCDATRVESVDDCLAKSGQSALRLVTVHHSRIRRRLISARARGSAPRRRPSRVLLRVPNRVVLAHNQGAEDASLARDSRSARPLPTSSTRRTTPASPRRTRFAPGSPVEDGRVPRDISRTPLRRSGGRAPGPSASNAPRGALSLSVGRGALLA